MSISLLIQIATLVSVLVGITGLVHGIRVYRRQANAQLSLEYTGRYEQIMQSFPATAMNSRLDMEGEPPAESEELRLCVLRYLNLASEEFYLCKKGYLSKDVWKIWERELNRTLRSPLYRREWLELRREFESYPEFLKYVKDVQSA